MKVRIEITDGDEEVVIRCRSLTDEVRRISEAVGGITPGGTTLALDLCGEEHFVPVEDILFFETDGGRTAAHTADRMYSTQYRLRELEELLPRTFARASKSCVVNTAKIESVSHSPVSASEARFAGTHKKIYISRGYYKAVREIIEETRIRK